MFKDKITSHRNKQLKKDYEFIHKLVKEVKINDLKDYKDLIFTSDLPEGLKIKAIKLVRKRQKEIKEFKKRFKFRLNLDTEDLKEKVGWWNDADIEVKAAQYDSRTIFIKYVRKSKNGFCTSNNRDFHKNRKANRLKRETQSRGRKRF